MGMSIKLEKSVNRTLMILTKAKSESLDCLLPHLSIPLWFLIPLYSKE